MGESRRAGRLLPWDLSPNAYAVILMAFGWHLGLDWSEVIPAVNEQIASDGYSLFMIFFVMIVLKGILNSMAGPVPTYDMQRMLAAKTPREAQAARDLSNVFVGVVWQTSLRLIPVFLIVFRLTAMWVAIGLAAVTTVILKFTWYDRLEDA